MLLGIERTRIMGSKQSLLGIVFLLPKSAYNPDVVFLTCLDLQNIPTDLSIQFLKEIKKNRF